MPEIGSYTDSRMTSGFQFKKLFEPVRIGKMELRNRIVMPAMETVVLAVGSRSNQELSEAIQGQVPEIYLGGDCVEARSIGEAVADGCRLGHTI